MRTLLINNYDSFTFNLFQMIATLTGIEPLVINNDEMSWVDACRLDFSNIVISPGPGQPSRARDFGISRDAILDGRFPLLGVCLGHQGICHLFGGRVVHAPEPMHGRISAIRHDGSLLFKGIPSPFKAVRYHSLIAEDLPNCLIPSAWTDCGLLMAARHTAKPLWGVQFHPESICTEYGATLLSNFLGTAVNSSTAQLGRPVRRRVSRDPASLKIYSKRLDFWISSECAFTSLFADANPAFWLDSSTAASNASRYSFMGDAQGPLSEVLDYDLEAKRLQIRRGEDVSCENCSILDYLARRLPELRADQPDFLPFDFSPGYVGYFGYEMKAETGGAQAHSSPISDSQWIFADRVICFDHQEQIIWLLCCDLSEKESRAEEWFATIQRRLLGAASSPARNEPLERRADIISFESRISDESYLRLIERCLSAIRDGESYEICLTKQIAASVSSNDLEIYLRLRRANPAPYSALVRFGDVRILCCSPERFIRCGRGGELESKPIKGTIRRGSTIEEDAKLSEQLRTSEKERAENLMIVDLIRNDLGRVCEAGSVCVPNLFTIESYATVHQLVSTVRGRLRPECSIVDVIRAMFPGGSMTGAPKVRTMEIIDQLEGGPRGIYSGALGYISVTGTADLNIVIRTIVSRKNSISIGVGGAITALSQPVSEVEETHLKARALQQILAERSSHEIIASGQNS
ncbi:MULTISPECIES: aminodeoxychorismate synthase component I [unclassified Bradyrhizobium]|uniref:aminodeoxychorismate synthase component I n=1 Tax=unclassified Bradyrhizobium TaxID=2631580 RepID=UPI002915D787|nr:MULTISPECIES: aminodeoxychorismate synthase component I [unclassified Bradyrhizobium]